MSVAGLAQQMIADARAFYEFGWMLGTSGNLSVRLDAGTFLITASGLDKGRLDDDDFLVCGLDARPADPTQRRRASAETAVHGVVYRELPDVGAIYHVHEPYSALCSDRDAEAGATRFEDLEMIKGLDIWDRTVVSVPIVGNHADIPTLARAIGEAIDPAIPAVNIERHGFYTWGAGPFEAKRHTETLAYLYRFSWETRRG